MQEYYNNSRQEKMFKRLVADESAKIFQLLNSLTVLVGYHGSWKRQHEKGTFSNLHTF